MNVLSLFDGMSCGRIALQKNEIIPDNYFASEIDQHAIKIAKKNFPYTIHIGDVRDVDASLLPKIDLLIGGSPCQSLTFAGKRVGLSSMGIDVLTYSQYAELKEDGFEFDGQSYLFWEYVRLLNETKPKWFLLENVKMENKWKDVFSSILGVEPVLINSSDFSAQRRQRYYWTNIPLGKRPPIVHDKIGDIRDLNEDGYHLSVKHLEAFHKSYKWTPNEDNEKSKPLLASYYKQPPHCPYIRCGDSPSGFRRLSPSECELLQTVPVGYTEGVSDTQRYRMLGNGWTVDVISYLLKGVR